MPDRDRALTLVVSRCKRKVNSRILIAASGTGGHLLPAVVIAKKLREINSGCALEFVGSGRPLEEKVIEGAGFRRHVVPISGFVGGGIFGAFSFLCKLPGALVRAWSIVSEFKPDVVVGVGGYVSVPVILIAWIRGVPAWIHEAEIKAGWANFFLSGFASRISVAFDNTKIPFRSRSVVTGHPVRDGLVAASNERSEVTLPNHLLILGGSQGANAIDLAIEKLIPFLNEKGLSVVHQARTENVERLASCYLEAKVEASVLPFIEDMPEKFAWSDIVISRAGAGATTDIGVVNRPAILVPFPFAQGQHQRANAMTLVTAGKAILVEEGSGFEERLQIALQAMLEPARFRAMKEKPRVDRGARASESISRGILELAAAAR